MKTFKTFLYESTGDTAVAVASNRRAGIEHFHAMKPHLFIDWIDSVKKDAKGILKDIKTVTKVDGMSCLHYNTKIETLEYGNIPIGKIVEENINCHAKSWDEEENEIVYKRVTNSRVLPEGGDWFEIESENGETIIITGNHQIYMPNLKCYRRVDEMQVGDEILVCKS